MLTNDDMIFRSRHWDKSIMQAFLRFPGDPALVYGNDLDYLLNKRECIVRFYILLFSDKTYLISIEPLTRKNRDL